nr:MAG TPA: hypothetical protein [Caudoviricetes sp.]DAU13385.1 MAG TPA: hypothetical protein [Caudoviricetes sp.]
MNKKVTLQNIPIKFFFIDDRGRVQPVFLQADITLELNQGAVSFNTLRNEIIRELHSTFPKFIAIKDFSSFKDTFETNPSLGMKVGFETGYISLLKGDLSGKVHLEERLTSIEDQKHLFQETIKKIVKDKIIDSYNIKEYLSSSEIEINFIIRPMVKEVFVPFTYFTVDREEEFVIHHLFISIKEDRDGFSPTCDTCMKGRQALQQLFLQLSGSVALPERMIREDNSKVIFEREQCKYVFNRENQSVLLMKYSTEPEQVLDEIMNHAIEYTTMGKVKKLGVSSLDGYTFDIETKETSTSSLW